MLQLQRPSAEELRSEEFREEYLSLQGMQFSIQLTESVSAGLHLLREQPPEHPLYLLVPQGINERVQCGSAHCIEETKKLAPLLCIGIFGLQINSNH